jgi:sterol desaturase/sphingolipid hydroxylase (fatty acid hydroxylase superfamily)
MKEQERLKYLKISLRVFGSILIVGIFAMINWIFPEGWSWTPRQPEYEQMIMGVYATLGVFLIRAAKDPLANSSLIWFTVWSSIVHGGIMLVQAIVDETERPNLLGDVPALFLVAFVLWYLMPKQAGASG